MDDFIKKQGLSFLAHLLRRLSDDFVRGFAAWNEETGIRAPPRTHSTLRALDDQGPLGVTEIALLLRQSHPLVITWIRQLKELGLVEARLDPNDRRRTVLSLTPAGEAEVETQKGASLIMERAFQRLMAEADADIFDALWRMEEALLHEPFLDRLRKESAAVTGTSG